jgi:hypothetical protein
MIAALPPAMEQTSKLDGIGLGTGTPPAVFAADTDRPVNSSNIVIEKALKRFNRQIKPQCYPAMMRPTHC